MNWLLLIERRRNSKCEENSLSLIVMFLWEEVTLEFLFTVSDYKWEAENCTHSLLPWSFMKLFSSIPCGFHPHLRGVEGFAPSVAFHSIVTVGIAHVKSWYTVLPSWPSSDFSSWPGKHSVAKVHLLLLPALGRSLTSFSITDFFLYHYSFSLCLITVKFLQSRTLYNSLKFWKSIYLYFYVYSLPVCKCTGVLQCLQRPEEGICS